MGESACLLRSFSHPCDASREANEGDPIRVLGESISFGRFMSESLAWEKFSAFSHNRYQEELEKFSKPGSVAQKKAYFEAHYKRKAAQKAAAELEEANTTAAMSRVITKDISCLNSEPLRLNDQLVHEEANTAEASSQVETEDNSCFNSELLRRNDQLVHEEANTTEALSRVETEDDSCINSCGDSEMLSPNNQVIETSEQENFVQNAEFVSPIDDADTHDPMNEESMMETDKVEEEVLEQNSFMEIAPNVDHTKQNENVEDRSEIAVSGDEKTPASYLQPAAEKEVRSSGGSLKRLRNYSTKLLTRSWSSKPQSSPSKQATNSSQQFINEGNATPKSKKHVGNVVEKAMKSIHMSRHFSPSLKEIGKTIPNPSQIGRKRTLMSSVVAPKEISTAPQKITNRASVNGFLKQPLIKPPLESKRCFKSSNASGTERKERPPLICSPFSFRSEERVAKRREFFQKLEERANSKEMMGQKQLQARCQETKKNSITKLRQSKIFEAKAHENCNQESKSTIEHINRIPGTKPQSPKLGRKSASSSSTVHNISSLPPKGPSIASHDAKSVIGKRYGRGGTARSVTSLGKKMNGCENSSPNIPS